MKVFQAMFEYLCSFLHGEPVASNLKLLNEDALDKLLSFAKKHDLAHLMTEALEYNGVLPENSEIKKQYIKERNLAVYRYEQMNYEFKEICGLLEVEKIPFIPLKGAIIRGFYPEPWMRTSCDIDILVRGEDIQKSADIIKEKLGYTRGNLGDHDISMFAPSGGHLEMHYHLVTPTAKAEEVAVFEKVWSEGARARDPLGYRYDMSEEYLYCYHISHLVKHLRCGGSGIRTVLDTWILNNRVEYDAQKRDALLAEAGLLRAARAIERLAEIWFSKAESDALSEMLGEYIVTGGVYGSFENRVAMQQAKKRGKISYLLSRFFLPYEEMKFKYPTLQKWPILYPFYIVKRMFLLFNKETKERVTNEFNQTVSGDEEKKKNVVKLLNELEL